jgi:hypothetical protein
MNVYERNYNLKHFVEPGAFLLARAKGEGVCRMGMYINNFKEAAIAMDKFLIKWLAPFLQ